MFAFSILKPTGKVSKGKTDGNRVLKQQTFESGSQLNSCYSY